LIVSGYERVWRTLRCVRFCFPNWLFALFAAALSDVDWLER